VSEYSPFITLIYIIESELHTHYTSFYSANMQIFLAHNKVIEKEYEGFILDDAIPTANLLRSIVNEILGINLFNIGNTVSKLSGWYNEIYSRLVKYAQPQQVVETFLGGSKDFSTLKGEWTEYDKTQTLLISSLSDFVKGN
jgi:hypothetical protein